LIATGVIRRGLNTEYDFSDGFTQKTHYSGTDLALGLGGVGAVAAGGLALTPRKK
jgi:hypothetical protein